MNDENRIPEHMRQILDDYVTKGWLPGIFLTAVICNDLMGAAAHADHINIRLLPEYARYVYNNMPSACHGSPEIMKAWIAHTAVHTPSPEKERL